MHPPVFSIVFDYVRVCLVHVGGCSETNGALSAGTETHNIYLSPVLGDVSCGSLASLPKSINLLSSAVQFVLTCSDPTNGCTSSFHCNNEASVSPPRCLSNPQYLSCANLLQPR